MKKFAFIIVLLALAGFAGWFLRGDGVAEKSGAASQKILFYQSPMHPWVKSDKPGKCTVCGMDLVPIYAGGMESEINAVTSDVMLPEGAPQASSIRTAKVQLGKLTRTLRFAGVIEDNDSRHRVLSAYTGGRIEKLFANFEGAKVEAGQPLALFYSQQLLSVAREYTLSRMQNNAALSNLSATRLRQMGLTPEQIAKVPDRAKDDLFFEILAPISGTVVKRVAYEGQTVAEGEPLMEIADFSIMWLQFQAYEQDLPFLKIGQEVEVSLPSLPGKTLRAPITFINPNVDNMTRSAMVRVEIPNSDGGLLHKLFAEVNVAYESPEVLLVPRSAVLWPAKQPRVYVEKSTGQYDQRLVSLGQAGDDSWEVLEGLDEGERVIVSGNMLVDGQAQINQLVASDTSAPSGETVNYLAAVAALGQALSADDWEKYRAELAKLPAAPTEFAVEVPAAGTDLKTARTAFQPFSESVVVAAQKVREGVPKLKIFTCPMSNMAGGGIPKNARWVQMTADIRNPYLGSEMLECGSEVPPLP